MKWYKALFDRIAIFRKIPWRFKDELTQVWSNFLSLWCRSSDLNLYLSDVQDCNFHFHGFLLLHGSLKTHQKEERSFHYHIFYIQDIEHRVRQWIFLLATGDKAQLAQKIIILIKSTKLW